MKLSKKMLFIGVSCVVVLAGTLGGFAIASADDEGTTPPQVERVNLMDKVAEIYEKNTGVAIDSQELQKAFEEAGTAAQTEMRDQMLQKLIDDGKITQEQADQWKAWLDARPDALSDAFKTWLESRPDIPAMSGDRFGGMMPFGGHRGPGAGDGCFGGLRERLSGSNN